MSRISKIKHILIATIILVFALSTGCANQEKAAETTAKKEADTAAKESVFKRPEISTADEAQKLLLEGNKRYVSGKVAIKDIGNERRGELSSKGQNPFVTVVSCSDSRVPPEVIFDQALGDIFVIRSAGEVVDSIGLGSVEYGVEHLHTPLLVVLGHEKCGAVKATVDGGEAPQNITSILNEIKPSVEKAKAAGATGNELYEKATDENVEAVIAEIENSPVVKHLVESGKLTIVGAKYHLESGEVTFLNESK